MPQIWPRAIYTHCYEHSLNLAGSDTVRQCTVIGKAFDIVYGIMKLIKKSPRRQAALKTLKQEVGSESPGIQSFVQQGGQFVPILFTES